MSYVAKDTVDAAKRAREYVITELGLKDFQFELQPPHICYLESSPRVAVIRLPLKLLARCTDGQVRMSDMGYSVDFYARTGALASAPSREELRKQKELSGLFD